MFLKLSPFLYSLVFFLGLETLVFKSDFIFYILFFLFIFSLFGGRHLGKKWLYSSLPVLFNLSAIALLYLITLPYEQQIFIILATFMYYLAMLGAYRLGQYQKDQTANGMNMAATFTALFFSYTGIYGLYLNFLVPLYILMLAYLFVTAFLTYQNYSIISENKRIVWIYSLLISLVMSEIIWSINFWPFGYLTTGTIALILYYILWDLIRNYFLNQLSRRRVVANMIFLSILIVLILLSSKWIPVL
mgnify:CR=1 FL=1